MAKITVVGAGAIGTAVASKLQEKGHAVSLVAEQFPAWPVTNNNITSDLAAGIGCIFKPSSPLVAELVLKSYDGYMRLAADPEVKAVAQTNLKVVTKSSELPAWAGAVQDYTVLAEHRASYQTYAFSPPMLGQWRIRNLVDGGAEIQQRSLRAEEISHILNGQTLPESDYTVMTVGLRTRDVFPELKLYPVRGVLVHFPEAQAGESSAGGPQSFMDEATATYLVRRPGGPIVGGTFEEHVGSSSPSELEDLGQEMLGRVGRIFQGDGLNLEEFNFSRHTQISAGYRPAKLGDPVMDFGARDRRISVITGFGGQGWVSGLELARRAVEAIEGNLHTCVYAQPPAS